MRIQTLGIDLGKHHFHLHGVDERGIAVLQKKLTRAKLPQFMATLEPCLVGMEACGGAHYWARLLQSYGHEVRLMSPQFVKPYVKSNKNDYLVCFRQPGGSPTYGAGQPNPWISAGIWAGCPAGYCSFTPALTGDSGGWLKWVVG